MSGVQPFLFGDKWIEVKDGNDSVRAIFDDHYSRYVYADGRKPKLFVGPGEKLVMMTREATAICVFCKFRSKDGQTGVSNSIFRRTEIEVDAASVLLAAACALAWRRWPGERLYTYIDPKNVRPTFRAGRPSWGHCYYQNGWKYVGLTSKRLHILEKWPRSGNGIDEGVAA
jgi:hypothetical protein